MATKDPYDTEEDPTTTDPTTDPTMNPNPIPTNPDGSQVGSGTSWDPGSQAPSSAPSGYHWDANMAMFQPDAPPPTGPMVSTPGGSPGPLETTAPSPAATPAAAPAPQVAPVATPSGGTQAATTAASQAYTPQGTPPAVSAPNPGQDAFGQSIRDALMKALGQGPVSASDEDIAPAIEANRVATERGLSDQRNQIAERMNAQGLVGSGALDAQMQAARERATTGEAQFSGNAVLDQAKARRQQLTQMLQTGAGVMNADEQRQLQGKIADLDAYLREQGITNQDEQFYQSLGLNAAQFEQLMNNDAFRQMLGL